MRIIKPKLKSTKHTDDLREWVPSSFDSFLSELDHIVSSCEGEDPAPLFRGQTNCEWYLDSKIVRNCIEHIFTIQDYLFLKKEIRHTLPFHKAIASLILLKFGTIWNPSQELLEAEEIYNIDPWFELLKHLQQYPENDYFINGTFLLDWSSSKNISLYFAIYKERGEKKKISSGDGALWIYDAGATGKILQIRKFGEIISLMKKEEFLNGNKTFPLLLHPPKQTLQPRSMNQFPIYIAQMDYRYDLADVWSGYEERNNKRVFVKLILAESLKHDAANYLESIKVTEDVVYPE